MGGGLHQARVATPHGQTLRHHRCRFLLGARGVSYRAHLGCRWRANDRVRNYGKDAYKAVGKCNKPCHGVFYSPHHLHKLAALAAEPSENRKTRNRPKLWITKYRPSRMAWKTWRFRNGLSRSIPSWNPAVRKSPRKF